MTALEECCFAKIKDMYSVVLSWLIINQEGQSVKQVLINPHSYLSAKAVAHLERAYWVKCTTLLCFSLMQYSSGDKTSRWESSEPERTCWLTATLDTLARACTQTLIHTQKESFSNDASHLQTLWFRRTQIKMTRETEMHLTRRLKTDNLLFWRETLSDFEQ